MLNKQKTKQTPKKNTLGCSLINLSIFINRFLSKEKGVIGNAPAGVERNSTRAKNAEAL